MIFNFQNCEHCLWYVEINVGVIALYELTILNVLKTNILSSDLIFISYKTAISLNQVWDLEKGVHLLQHNV